LIASFFRPGFRTRIMRDSIPARQSEAGLMRAAVKEKGRDFGPPHTRRRRDSD